ncbi:GNAT family N-acetyltransferase [Sinorhizobium medicae]
MSIIDVEPVSEPVILRLVGRSAGETLRNVVLRSKDTAWLADCDMDSDHFHVAASCGRDVISTASFMRENLEDIIAQEAGMHWRLRAIATEPLYRSQGIGGRVLEFGIAEIMKRGGALVWCNGRVSAEGFYRRHGFEPFGPAFENPGTGLHLRFVRRI